MENNQNINLRKIWSGEILHRSCKNLKLVAVEFSTFKSLTKFYSTRH
jgi:hypothetical protein